MSRISKISGALALTASVMASSAMAEGASPSSTANSLLAELEKSGSTSTTSTTTMIEGRIRELMSEMGKNTLQSSTGNLTIEEIDKVNRMAERERTELQFEQTRFQRMQLEIERLMALYDAVKTLEADRQKAAGEQRAALASSMENFQSPDAHKAQSFSADQENLPRILSITGIGGDFSAEAAFDGERTLAIQPNTRTIGGFIVEDIQSSHVMIRGPQSGELFQLIPQSPPLPPPSQGGDSPGGVIDLSQFPMAQF